MTGDGPVGLHDILAGDQTRTDLPPRPPRHLPAALTWWWGNRKRRLAVFCIALLIVLGVLFAIPFTRYEIAGLFVKEQVTVTVVDSATSRPVSGVVVRIDGKETTTGAAGVGTVRVKPGDTKVSLSKQYYQSTSKSFTVPLSQKKLTVPILALGRQVPVKVTDAVSGKPLGGVTISAGTSTSTTDSTGQTVVTVPSEATAQDLSIKADGYNVRQASLTISNNLVDANTLALTPAGTVYFVSNKSGTIDVVASDLDGSNRRVVLAGTGNESGPVQFIASPDSRYLALVADRSARASSSGLYLIDVANNNKMTTIDEANASFSLVGWMGNRLIYTKNRNDLQYWRTGQNSIVSLNAETGTFTTLEQQNATDGSASYNYNATRPGTPILLANEIVYPVTWFSSFNYGLAGQTQLLVGIKPDGSGRHIIQDYVIPAGGNVTQLVTTRSGPNSIYVAARDPLGPPTYGYNSTYAEYKNGSLSPVNLTAADFAKNHGPYFASPAGGAVVWSEIRDGASVLIVGDTSGANGKVVASLKEYSLVSWYSDKCFLLSKDGNELYLFSADGSGAPFKVTDYYSSSYGYYN